MLRPDELETLDAALARIVPVPQGQASVRAYARRMAEAQLDVYRATAILLQGRRFVELSAEMQDNALRSLEGHPSLAIVVQHAIEGLYTSEAGFAEVGFRVTA